MRNHAIYRLLPNPPADAARGSCYLSGSGGPCVDTGALVYMEGTLVLSVGVIREMAEVAGFNVVDGVELEQANAELEHTVAGLREQVALLEEELDIAARLTARRQKAAR